MKAGAPAPALAPTVLIVDDVPQNLAVLHDTLDESGYRVLVATRGAAALERARQSQPAIILLDAVMPGMDGFEVCRALRADPATADIPVIFMTGLTETEDVVRGFDAGGNDYITKPVRPHEVLARIAAHLERARRLSEARAALDTFGRATLAFEAVSGRLLWQTPAAGALLARHLPDAVDAEGRLPLLRDWLAHLRSQLAQRPRAAGTDAEHSVSLRPDQGPGQLQFTLRGAASGGEWLVGVRWDGGDARTPALALRFGLTPRESEVLYWVALGKTNRDIAGILDMSPRTADKHLQHVLDKLGVETRTAAAGLALAVLREDGATS
ncbi:MAG: response regulator transcription factor [Pseudomonadota bacterium]|nr:response regulator transcription factor [Pseudomonadota bacterium]